MTFRKTRHHAQAYVTLGTLVNRGLSLAARWTKTAVELRGFHWPVLVMTAVEPHSIYCCCTWSSNQLGVGWSWLFPVSLIKFLTRRSLKSRWVYWAPHEDNRIQRVEKQFRGPLEVMLTHRIAVGHTIWNVDENNVLVIPFHDVRLHGAVAVITEISFCRWWLHVRQHVNFWYVLPN